MKLNRKKQLDYFLMFHSKRQSIVPTKKKKTFQKPRRLSPRFPPKAPTSGCRSKEHEPQLRLESQTCGQRALAESDLFFSKQRERPRLRVFKPLGLKRFFFFFLGGGSALVLVLFCLVVCAKGECLSWLFLCFVVLFLF